MPPSQSRASRMRFNRSTPTCITLAPQRRDHEQALLNLAGTPERKKPAFAERSKAGSLFSLEQALLKTYCTAGVAPTIRNLYQDVPAGYSTSRIWAFRSSPGPRLNGTVPLFTSNAAVVPARSFSILALKIFRSCTASALPAAEGAAAAAVTGAAGSLPLFDIV